MRGKPTLVQFPERGHRRTAVRSDTCKRVDRLALGLEARLRAGNSSAALPVQFDFISHCPDRNPFPVRQLVDAALSISPAFMIAPGILSYAAIRAKSAVVRNFLPALPTHHKNHSHACNLAKIAYNGRCPGYKDTSSFRRPRVCHTRGRPFLLHAGNNIEKYIVQPDGQVIKQTALEFRDQRGPFFVRHMPEKVIRVQVVHVPQDKAPVL